MIRVRRHVLSMREEKKSYSKKKVKERNRVKILEAEDRERGWRGDQGHTHRRGRDREEERATIGSERGKHTSQEAGLKQ